MLTVLITAFLGRCAGKILGMCTIFTDGNAGKTNILTMGICKKTKTKKNKTKVCRSKF